jgi:hypothetical protein
MKDEGPKSPPEFTAYEINALNKRLSMDLSQERRKHYQDLHEFLIKFEQDQLKWVAMTIPQRKYLWAIKFELKELVK